MIETVRRYFGSGLGSRRPRMVFPGYALKFLQLKWEEAVNMWQGKQELKMEPWNPNKPLWHICELEHQADN